MSRIIVDCDTGVPWDDALNAVAVVIRQGLISSARGVLKHCHVTQVTCAGTNRPLVVYAKDRRSDSSAHSFQVARES